MRKLRFIGNEEQYKNFKKSVRSEGIKRQEVFFLDSGYFIIIEDVLIGYLVGQLVAISKEEYIGAKNLTDQAPC